jgi:hypothetical protein
VVLAGCGAGEESKANACTAWNAAMEQAEVYDDAMNSRDYPDTGDFDADFETMLNEVDKQIDHLVASKKKAKAAFTKAAADDEEWLGVQQAAYDWLENGEGDGRATVRAACDLINE